MHILAVLLLVAMIYPFTVSSQPTGLLPYAIIFTIDIPGLHEHCYVPVVIHYLGCFNPQKVSVL